MKKVLLIGFVLAICVLAFPQGVMALEKPVTVDATFAVKTFQFDAVTNSASPAVWPWVLSVGPDNINNDALKFTVDSSRLWEITAYDYNYAATHHKNGYMFGTDPNSLINPFEMQVGGTGGVMDGRGTVIGLPASPISILKGNPNVDPQIFYSDIWQKVQADDFGATDGYHITLYFVATESWG
jgi:hypothetical protein